MYIEELHIAGYGRISNLRIEPSHGLNILEGPAGVGKTTVCNCVRDLLLGPGRWDSAEGGPRAPHARPQVARPYQARASYSVGSARYTVMRDFESLEARVRDDRAGVQIADLDPRGPAPGVVAFRLDESAVSAAPTLELVVDERLRAAHERAAWAAGEATAWEYRLCAATVADLEARLRSAAELRVELEGLRPTLGQLAPYAQVARERRDEVIRAGERYRAAERDHADAVLALDRQTEARREVGTKLSAYERFYTVTDADLEMMKTLEVSEGPGAHITEKERNLEGFRLKEADIELRLAEVRPRFEGVTDHDAYDQALADHERELRSSEKLGLKTAERQRVRASIDRARSSSLRMILLGLAAVLVGVGLVATRVATTPGGLLALGGLALLMKAVAERERVRAFENDDVRLTRDIEALQAMVEKARGELRRMIEASGVHTIQEARALHRELRALQRDIETVRFYRTTLERELDEARKTEATRRVATPRLLVECAILAADEAPTSRAVADFFDAYHNFKALRQEEESLQKRLVEMRAEVDARARERDALKAALDAALSEMGMASEAEMDTAVSGRREHDRVKAQVDVLEEKVLVALRGLNEEEAARQIDAAQARLASLVAADAALVAREQSLHDIDECRERLREAQQVMATAQGEIAALEGAAPAQAAPTPTEAGVSPECFARAVSDAWLRVTGQPLEMRARESQGRAIIDVREREEGAFMPPRALGSVSAQLLAVLAEGERVRLGGAGLPPFIVDNPFVLLSPEVRGRLAEWLVDLSATVQMFVTLSTPEGRDVLVEVLRRRGCDVRRERVGDIEMVHGVPPEAVGC